MTEKLLTGFIKVWVSLFILFIAVSTLGYFLKEESLFLEFIDYRSKNSALSPGSLIILLFILYPAIISYAVREKIRGTLETSLMGPRWYFKRGLWSLFTIPLFLFLSSTLAMFIFGTIIHSFALFRVSGSVYGLPGGGIAFFLVGWILTMLASYLCFLLLKTPGVWVRQNETHVTKILLSAGILIAFLLAGSLVSEGVSLSIGWIADRDPCAAYAGGVTGSVGPENCEQVSPEEKKSFWTYLFKLFIGSMLAPILFPSWYFPYMAYSTLPGINRTLNRQY